ncbi:hypothetical protein [Sedimentibacter sp. MB31-C6]|nr:hypothetical protein [Sedimentibacter sp. MB36-C1]WSI05099.1 hypothetical protein U8307_04720 [Sedimentibacter sp. MB36-C1]
MNNQKPQNDSNNQSPKKPTPSDRENFEKGKGSTAPKFKTPTSPPPKQ